MSLFSSDALAIFLGVTTISSTFILAAVLALRGGSNSRHITHLEEELRAERQEIVDLRRENKDLYERMIDK